MSEEAQKILMKAKNNPAFPYKGWRYFEADMPPSDENQEDGEGDGDSDDSSGSGGKHKNYGDAAYDTKGGKYEIIKVGDATVKKYNSLDDMIDDADDVKNSRFAWDDKFTRLSRLTNREEWFGGKTFEEALYHARYGWDKGVVKMDTLAQEYHRRSRWSAGAAISLDVAGSHPDVPTFLSGNPSNMFNTGDNRQKIKPIVHILVNKSHSWNISSHRIFNFGAALMVCIDQIEATGVKVELEAILSIDTYVNRMPHLSTTVMIKKANEVMEKNRIAFAMAHPGFFRRLWFSIVEQTKELNFSDFIKSYGRIVPVIDNLVPPECVYINNINEMGGFDSMEEGVAQMQKLLGITQDDDGHISLNKEEREAA